MASQARMVLLSFVVMARSFFNHDIKRQELLELVAKLKEKPDTW
jgi:hypothetical protein